MILFILFLKTDDITKQKLKDNSNDQDFSNNWK